MPYFNLIKAGEGKEKNPPPVEIQSRV